MELLLAVHITAGVFALAGAALALSCEKGNQLHRLSGATYFWAMLAMWVLAVIYFFTHNYRYIILAAFGFIALAIGYQDYIRYKNTIAVGKRRIAGHLTRMLGGTIAVITAVLIVSVNVEPVWILWILPTVIIAPTIIWWNIKTLG